MTKKKLQVSFSGGRTSAYMSIWLKHFMSDVYDMKFVFANTGWEHPDTLRFVHAVDDWFDLGVVWVEAVPRREQGKSSGHKIVTYETASRNGEPFEAVVSQYGIPNHTFKLCTRELKANAMRDYIRSCGWKKHEYQIAVGFRIDETRRISQGVVDRDSIIYPLIDMIPTAKEDILIYFEQFEWDLKIPEYKGNCLGCFKKSEKKLLQLYRDDPTAFEFPIKLEKLYGNVGPNNVPGPRRMYRYHRSAEQLTKEFDLAPPSYKPPATDGGCSESCEPFDVDE